MATYLSGRYVEFEIFSFGFSEFLQFKKLEANKKNFLEYLKSGGLPEMFFIEGQDIQRHYVDSLKNTIILRDIIERNNIKDSLLLEDIFKFILSNIGNLTSIPSLIKYFKNIQKKTNFETLSLYVSYLVDTMLVHQAEKFNLRGQKILSGEKKYYLGDLAFKNYLLGFTPSDIGNNLENYVYMQLRRMGYDVFVGVLDNYEIDFVAQKETETLYVQVAYLLTEEATVETEFGNLLKIRDNYKKVVISMDDLKFDNYKGIAHMSPWDLR